MKKINFKLLLSIVIVTFLIGNLFSFTIIKNMDIYRSLIKPFEIPMIVFPIVWTILYLLMSVSLYRILRSDNNIDSSLIIYLLNLVFNSLWTLIYFGLCKYLFAFIWLLLLIIIVVIMIVQFYRKDKVAGLINIPYLFWLLFAAYLNYSIYLLN